ncbi:acylphosphatase [Anaerofilum sp. BX8]|uniref:acylphosphatase n=1 Tax=Anaerofilum hominis TaxID=2763016 RepID=A0A923KYG1_9FIRM|nr:acylphosphatase [Anaerofilum hominis]MBC5581964.1 acylphosphatase [Anaerofilum hominis]
MERLYIRIGGCVQGVGYRYYAVYSARRLGLTGWVRNREDGDLELEAQGAPDDLEAFCEAMRRGPHYAQVQRFETQPLAPVKENNFSVADW